MKKTLQRQGVMLALALLVSVCAMACGPGESSGKKGNQQPATGEAAQTAKPGAITKTSEALKPGAVDTVDLGGGVKMEMVWVTAGSFQMGSNEYDSEKPIHTVELDGFWMGKYEVTQEQYEAVMGKNPSWFKGAKNPVEQVSWNDAMDFCQKASQKTGKDFRLPTEAEWEYACRAGTRTPFSFGETISTDQANYDGRYIYGSGRKGEDRGKTVPVGSFQPNAWGLYDMHGNVWEWCLESSGGQGRVSRGGSWCNGPDYCRSATRAGFERASTYLYLGFRVVRGEFFSR